MKLAALIAAPSLQRQLLDHQNACVAVNRHAFAITNTSLPTVSQSSANYRQFLGEYGLAKAHCLEWTTGIFPVLLSFNQTVIGAAELFGAQGDAASYHLAGLIHDPSNEQARSGLADALDGMRRTISGPLRITRGMLIEMSTFASRVRADATRLAGLATHALRGTGDDQARIISLNQLILALHDRAEQLSLELAAAGVGPERAVNIDLLGCHVCRLPDSQGAVPGVAVLAVANDESSSAETIAHDRSVGTTCLAIATAQDQITRAHRYIVALQAVSDQFSWLDKADLQAGAAVSGVAQLWQDLDDELAAAQQHLTAPDATTARYEAAIGDLAAASKAWDSVVGYARGLAAVSYHWQGASGNWHSFTGMQPALNNATVTMLSTTAAAAVV